MKKKERRGGTSRPREQHGKGEGRLGISEKLP